MGIFVLQFDVFHQKMSKHLKHAWLYLYYSYYVIDLVEAGVYVVHLKFKVCFEADESKPCDIDFTLFDHYILPKETCNWATDFNVPGKNQCFEILLSFWRDKYVRVNMSLLISVQSI